MAWFLLLLILVFVLLATRCCYLLFTRDEIKFGVGRRKTTKPVRLMIVIGSGGHTAEMLCLLADHMDLTRYSPRVYLKSSTDTTSEARILETDRDFVLEDIPRSRHVGQTYISAIWTTVVALVASFPPLLRHRPHLILCNGPGTCLPVCLAAFALRLLFLLDTRLVFVESFCRVYSLSLTGRLLLLFADHVVVQWPELHKKYPSTKYLGRLTL